MRSINNIGLLILFVWASHASADGIAVSKIYHPYVNPMEWELESRTFFREKDSITGESNDILQSLGLGHAISDRVFAEVYLRASDDPVTDDIEWVGIEFEALVQLSEQGEYLADYGLLVEYERDWELNNNEIVVKGLMEREFGRLSVTLNPGIAYEWGENRQDEFETKLSAMLRYRYHPRFEPSFEVHLGQVSKMAGPSVGGRIRLPAPGTSLSYDFGTFFPLDQESSEYTVRLQIEYEF
jgi:hypothetical protein